MATEIGGPKLLRDKRCKGGNKPLGEPLPFAWTLRVLAPAEGAGL